MAGSPQLEITANFTLGRAVRQHLHGREYLVAPITSIVPGVLAGSRGPLLYRPQDISQNVQSWDGLPLTAWHPESPDGQHVSASSPGVIDRQGIGVVRDSAYNGKLQHKAWFDVEKTRHVDNTLLADKPDQQILPRLLRGDPVEISTGLYTDNEPAPPGATFNGVPYDYVATNYRGDHIAVLPDQIGACSIADGCGVLVNEATGPVQNAKVASSEAPTTTAPSAPTPKAKSSKVKSGGSADLATPTPTQEIAAPTSNAASDGHPTVEELGLDESDLRGMDEREIEQLEERMHTDLDGDGERGEPEQHRRAVLGPVQNAAPIQKPSKPQCPT